MKLLTERALLSALFLSVATLASRAYAQEDVNSNIDVHLYGGDIMLTPEQQATIEATSNPNDPFAPQNAVVRNTRSLWPNGRVPYILDSSLDQSARSAIQEGINEYARLTCIRFVQRTNEADYVRFFRGRGCFSFIGRTGGPQDISIGSGCAFRGIVMHEMFHALGRWHEQSRPDRDLFVRINEENIQSGVESNFETVRSAFVTTQGVPYDLGSVMHYGAFAFSRNRQPTIVPVDSSISLNSLGQRNGFSSRDLIHVNTLYCGGGTPNTATWSSWSSWSSCSRTCNGGTRTRSRSCTGGTSCSGSNIDTEQCNTNQCPVVATWGTWTTWSRCSATCGGGRRTRVRSCLNGNTCVGQNTQFSDCNSQNCPEAPTWTSWGSWSSCSATCQGGNRLRRRTCQNGNNCPGFDFETEFCNSNIPCTSQPNPNSGEWTTWSECTRTCGGGRRFRVRMCGTDNCAFQQQNCNSQDCNPEPSLRGLQHIGCYYVPRFSRALGLLEGLRGTDLLDNPFTRTDPIRKCGQAARLYSFTNFAVSAKYCISGSNRLSDYQYVQTTLCQDGVGGYVNGYFVMDVYQIVNTQTFRDSAAQVANPNATIVDNNNNGSQAARSSNFVTLLATLAVLITVLTILQ